MTAIVNLVVTDEGPLSPSSQVIRNYSLQFVVQGTEHRIGPLIIARNIDDASEKFAELISLRLL